MARSYLDAIMDLSLGKQLELLAEPQVNTWIYQSNSELVRNALRHAFLQGDSMRFSDLRAYGGFNVLKIDPTVHMLRDGIVEADKGPATDGYTARRPRELAEFFKTTTFCYNQIRSWPAAALGRFVKAHDEIRKLLGMRDSK